MSGNNDLKIIIQAAIDPVKNKETLQNDLKQIKDLKIDIGIDTKILDKLSKQIGDIQKVITQQSKNFKIFDEDQLNKDLNKSTDGFNKLYKDVKNVLSSIEKEYSKLGQITFPKTSFDPITKELTGFTLQIKKADETIEKLKFDLINLSKNGSTDLSKAFLLNSQTGSDKTNALIDKSHANALVANSKFDANRQKEQENLDKLHLQAIEEDKKRTEKNLKDAETLDKLHYQAIQEDIKRNNQQQKLLDDLDKVHYQAIEEDKRRTLNRQKAEDDLDKLHYQAIEEDRKRTQKINDSIHSQALSANKTFDQNSNAQTNLLTSVDQAHASYHGNIDSTALKDLVQRIKEIDPASTTAARDLQKMQQELRQLKVDASEAANSITGKLKHSIESMALWGVGGGLFFGTQQAISGVIENIGNVEKSMAGLRQTIPEIHDSQTALNDATGQFVGIAEKYGESVSSIIDNAKLWSRQYKDLGTVIELVNSSVLLSVVDNVSLEEANKSVESIMVQMGMVIDQTKSKAEQQAQAFEYSRKIVDSFSNASHQSMISANDLATGLERSANVAKKVGVDFDQLVGLMTASVRSTGLAGSNLGNMWKTVFGSIHDTKTAVPELEAIGVQMKQIGKDGIETWTPVADVMRQVMILTAGTQKDTEQLTKAAAGGKFQWAKLSSALTDYKTFLDSTQQSIMGTGSSMQYVGVQLETLSKKYDSLKQHLVALSVATGEGGLSSTLKSVVDSLTTLVSGFEHVDGSTIAWTTSIALLAMGFGKFVKALEVASEAEKGFATITATVDALTGNWGNLLAAIAVGGLTMYAFGAGKAAEAQEKLNSAMDEAVKTAPQIADQYTRRAQFLRDTLNDIKLIQQQLNSDEAKSNPQRRQQLEDDLKYAQQAMLKMAGSDYASNIKNSNFSDLSVEGTAKSLELQANKAKSMIEMGQGLDVTLQSLTERYVQLKKSMDDGSLSDVDKAKNLNDLHSVTNQLTEILPSLKVGYDKNGEAVLVFDNAIKNNTTSMKNYYDMLDKTKSVNLAAQIDEQTKALEKAKKALDDKKAQLVAGAKVDDPFNIGGNGKNDLNLTRLDPEKLKTLRGEVDQLSQTYQKEADKLNTLKASQKDASQTTNEYTQEVKNAYLGHAELGKIIGGQVDVNEKQVSLTKEQTANLKVLNQAEYELNKNGELSSETTQKLTKINGDYTDAIGKGKDAVLEMIKTQKQEQTTAIDGEIQKTKNLLDQVQARIDLHILEAKAIKQVADMEAEIANSQTDNAMTAREEKDLTNKINMFQKQPLSADAQSNLEDLKKQAESLTSSLGGLNATKEDYLKNDKLIAEQAKENAKTQKELTDNTATDAKNAEEIAQKNYENALKYVEQTISLAQRLQSEQVKGSQAEQYYINQEIEARQKKIDLLKQEQARQQDLAKTSATSASESAKSALSSTKKYTGKYANYINAAAQANGIDPNFIAAQIQQESGFNANEKNGGLFQLSGIELKRLNGKSVNDPQANINAGAKLMAEYIAKYKDPVLALAAYNMGPGIIDFFSKHGGYSVANMQAFSNMQKKQHGYNVYGDPNYVNHVMGYYSGDKNSVSFAKQSVDAEGKTIDLSAEIQQEMVAVEKLRIANLDSVFQGFANKTKVDDDAIELSKTRMQQYNVTSEEYRKELDLQGKSLADKQTQVHAEANEIRYNINLNQQRIDQLNKLYELEKSGKQLTADQQNQKSFLESVIITDNNKIKSWKDRVSELGKTWWDVTDAIKSTNEELAKSKLGEIVNSTNDIISPTNDVIDELKAKMDLLGKTDYVGRDTLINVIGKQYEDQIPVFQNSIAKIEDLNKSLDHNSQQWKDNEKQIRDYEKQMLSTAKSVQDMRDTLNGDIASILQEQEQSFQDNFKKQHDTTIQNMENNLKSVTDSYDQQNKLLEDKLKLLDEEYNKEDKIKKLNDINTQLNQAKADTSHEYIDASGKVELTYDKAKVADLKKQQDDLIQQYNREDVKTAIQSQIDTLKNQKDQQTKLLQDQIDKTKQQYQQEEDDNKTHWDSLIKSAQNGTLKFDDLFNGKDGWYSKTISQLQQFGINSQTQVDQIKSIFASLSQLQINLPQIGTIATATAGGGGSSNSTLDMLGQKYNEAMAKGDTVSASFYHQAANDYRQQNGMQTYYDSNTDKSSSSHSSKSTGNSWSASQVSAARDAAIAAGGVTASSGKIPGFAVGGRVEKKTLAWVGEDEPETIIPDSFFKNQDGFTVGLNKIDTSKFNLSNILKSVDLVKNLASNIKLPDFSSIMSKIAPQTIDQSKTYQFNNVTIKSDNPMEFLNNINFLIRSQTT